MNIGISSLPLSPKYNNGRPDGMSVYTRNLIENFGELKHDISLWSFGRNNLKAQPPQGNRHFGHSFAYYSALSILSNKQSKVDLKADIFHVTDYRAIPMRCPMVTTLYDAIPLIHPEMANPRFRKLKNYILKNAAQCADHVIAISKYSVKEIVEYYQISPEIISVVLCGVDQHWLDPIPEEKWKLTLMRRGIRPGYFLFVGIIQPRKNLDRLMLAHDLLPSALRREHPLLVVGRRGWSCEQTINRLQKKYSMGEAFWFDDVYSQIELKHLYAGATIFIYPSLYEGFGLPILESFAMGIPVITSNASSLPEVSGGVGLEINPYDVDGMSNAIRQLLDPKEQMLRIPLGIKRAEELSWNRCAKETLKVYEKVAS